MKYDAFSHRMFLLFQFMAGNWPCTVSFFCNSPQLARVAPVRCRACRKAQRPGPVCPSVPLRVGPTVSTVSWYALLWPQNRGKRLREMVGWGNGRVGNGRVGNGRVGKWSGGEMVGWEIVGWENDTGEGKGRVGNGRVGNGRVGNGRVGNCRVVIEMKGENEARNMVYEVLSPFGDY